MNYFQTGHSRRFDSLDAGLRLHRSELPARLRLHTRQCNPLCRGGTIVRTHLHCEYRRCLSFPGVKLF